MRRWSLRLAFALGLWLLLELTAFAGLYALRVTRGITYDPLDTSRLSGKHRRELDHWVDDPGAYIAHSPTLGWTIRPRSVGRRLYRANGQGLRGDREYAPRPPEGTTRIAAFGDSFTHADEVANDATWTVALERSVSGIEVLNFGVSAFGLDQAYLRWREEGRSFHPHVVLIGYLTENIERNVNTFRPFYHRQTGTPLAKPRFTLGPGPGELVLQPNPAPRIEDYQALLADPATVLRRFGAHDYHYQHQAHASPPWDRSRLVRLAKLARYELFRTDLYDERSEAFAVTTRLFDRFVRDVRATGATPLIVVFPLQPDLIRQIVGERRVHQSVLDFLTRRGYDHVDLLDAFAATCRTGCNLDAIIRGHFTPAGNRVIGEHLAGALRARRLVP